MTLRLDTKEPVTPPREHFAKNQKWALIETAQRPDSNYLWDVLAHRFDEENQRDVFVVWRYNGVNGGFTGQGDYTFTREAASQAMNKRLVQHQPPVASTTGVGSEGAAVCRCGSGESILYGNSCTRCVAQWTE